MIIRGRGECEGGTCKVARSTYLVMSVSSNVVEMDTDVLPTVGW